MAEEDVPELQDFEEQIKIVTKDLKATPPPSTNTNTGDYTVPNIRHVEDDNQRKKMLEEVEKEVKKVEEKVQKKEEGGFGGFKKGFFGNPSKKTDKKQDKVVEIKKPEKKSNPLEIKEVQDAMKVNDYLNNTKSQWMTNDFLNTVSSNQKISKLFTNPEYMVAIDMFQKKPKEAMEKYGQNKQFMECFQQFCKLMGGQFTKLAQEEKVAKKP